MAALSPAGQDKLLMLGVGISAIVVIGLMRRMLVQYRDSSIIPASENKPQYITQDVEDSLKLSTLDKLLDSPNYCIQETTAIIICERALHDGATINALLWYITRPQHHMREKGIRALTMMMMMNSSTVSLLNNPAAYGALVTSLEYSVTDYKHNPFDLEWDNWHLRDVVEQGCILILCQLVDKHGVEGLVNAEFVERWLVKEPWGKDEFDRQNNFAESMGKENRLNEITLPLFRDPAGLAQLGKARLIPPVLVSELGSSREVKMTNGESTSGEDFEGMFVESRRRRDQTSADDHLRRRHREAMVLNDGTRPFGRQDIIQRERVNSV